MKTFTQAVSLLVRDVVGAGEILFTDTDGVKVEELVLARLEQLPAGGLLEVDFSDVRVASAAARRILRRALLRVIGGELNDRFIVVTGLEQGWYNVKVMLESEELTVVERPIDGSMARLLGKIDPAVAETYDYVRRRQRTTAQDVMKHFGQRTISAATNRLTRLASLSLARRIDQEPVDGGGRQYVYAAVC